ncbi:hypothetical protein D9M72_498780 [compost metagenome]
MDMPAMTPSTWLEDSACRAALKPSDLISTANPWFLAISRMMSMSMPVSSPPASRNSNGANVVSVPMTKVFPERLDGAAAGCDEPAAWCAAPAAPGASAGAAAAPAAPKSIAARASKAPMTVAVRGLAALVCWSPGKLIQLLGKCGSRSRRPAKYP